MTARATRAFAGQYRLQEQVSQVHALLESASREGPTEGLEKDPTVKPDNRLGPYEIVAPIGAGGMGEAYRAQQLNQVA